MDRKIALRWAKALESGKYKQTHGVLRTANYDVVGDANAFCCLGVLCNLHAQDHPEIAAQQDNPFEYIDSDVELPEVVKEWAGLKTTDGTFDFEFRVPGQETLATSLIDLNDEWEYDFKKIASVIRKHSAKL